MLQIFVGYGDVSIRMQYFRAGRETMVNKQTIQLTKQPINQAINQPTN